MPSLYRVTLGARADRGIPEEVEFWADLSALEDRLARPRALGRRITVDIWEWAPDVHPPQVLRLAA